MEKAPAATMQILSRLMMHTKETEAQLALQASVSMDLMMDVIGSLGAASAPLPKAKAIRV